MHDAQLVIIVGGSGIGKSALARSLQEQLLPSQWPAFERAPDRIVPFRMGRKPET